MTTSTDTPVDEAVAAGLSDVPADDEITDAELVDDDPEVVEVDTSRPKPADDEEVVDAEFVSTLPISEVGTSLVPFHEELRGAAAMAVTLALAGNVPKALREKPADVLAVILTGRELGVAPMTAIRTFHVIDGTVTVSPKVRAAMVRQQGLGELWPHQAPRSAACPLLARDGHGDGCPLCAGSAVVEQVCDCGGRRGDNDADEATWHARRADQPRVIYSSTYTRAMAGGVKVTVWSNGSKKNGSLLDKDNWINYPERMLSWRSLGYLLDDAFPEVGTGLYSPDEIGAVTDEQGEPILDMDADPLVPSTSGSSARPGRTPNADPPANPATLATLRARCEKLKTGWPPAAYDELKRLWALEGLPKLDALLHRQERDLSAVIDDVERRCAKGEFGEAVTDAELVDDKPGEEPGAGAPPADEAPPEDEEEPAAEEPEPEPEVDPEPEREEQQDPPPFDVSDLPSGREPADDLRWLVKAPDDVVGAVIAETKDVAKEDLTPRLRALGLPITGNEDQKRQRLATRIIRIRMERLAGIAPAAPEA